MLPASDSAVRHQRIKQIFASIVDAPPESRDSLLRTFCGDDESLASEVRSLLDHLAAPRLDMTAAANEVRGAVEAALGDLGAAGDAAPDQVADFRILRVLGEGGMGVVYLAEQDAPRRLVALKLVRPGLAGQEILRRFRREAEVLGSLRHPNIAQIYAAGTTVVDGPRGSMSIPYFAMEYVAGVPITEYCRARELSVTDRVRLFLCVCDAAEHAHGRGVVHRDLKPANILVEDADATTWTGDGVAAASRASTSALPPMAGSVQGARLGTPKILDFGIARRDAGADEMGATLRTAVDQVVGTLPYMSPEQFAGGGGTVDRRSDIYALGVILYQILAGRLPLEVANRSLADAARMVTDIEPPSLGSIDPALRGDLETVIAKCLEKEPQRRYQSAAELAADLRRFLEDRPIEARPPSGLYQFRKFARRNKGLVVGLALASVILVAATIVSIVLAARAIDARNDAQLQLNEAILQGDRSTQSYLILREIVDRIDPAAAGGQVPTIRDVLDAVRPRLESMSAEEPEVLALLLAEMARAYLKVGEADIADSLYAASLRNFRAAPRETMKQPMVFVDTLVAAADLAARRGRSDEARALRLDACALLESAANTPQLGAQSKATVHLTLGTTRWALGELEEARQHLERGIEIRRTLDLPGDTGVASYELVLATILMALGRPLDAEAPLRRSEETLRRLAGPENPETLKARSNLVTAINQAGRFEEGSALGQALLADHQRLGLDDAATAAVRLNVAFGLIGAGRVREAVPLCRQVLAWREKHLGPSTPETARARVILAMALRALGDLDEAQALLERAVADHRSAFGEGHLRVAEDLLELSALHLAQGRPSEARADAEAASAAILGFTGAFAGDEHPLHARALREVARAQAAQGEVDDALALATMALERIRSSTPAGHPQIADALLAIASIELCRGRAAEALSLADEAQQELRLNSASDVVGAPADAMRGAAMIALGRVEEGRRLVDEASRALVAALGPDAPSLVDVRRWVDCATNARPIPNP